MCGPAACVGGWPARTCCPAALPMLNTTTQPDKWTQLVTLPPHRGPKLPTPAPLNRDQTGRPHRRAQSRVDARNPILGRALCSGRWEVHHSGGVHGSTPRPSGNVFQCLNGLSCVFSTVGTHSPVVRWGLGLRPGTGCDVPAAINNGRIQTTAPPSCGVPAAPARRRWRHTLSRDARLVVPTHTQIHHTQDTTCPAGHCRSPPMASPRTARHRAAALAPPVVRGAPWPHGPLCRCGTLPAVSALEACLRPPPHANRWLLNPAPRHPFLAPASSGAEPSSSMDTPALSGCNWLTAWSCVLSCRKRFWRPPPPHSLCAGSTQVALCATPTAQRRPSAQDVCGPAAPRIPCGHAQNRFPMPRRSQKLSPWRMFSPGFWRRWCRRCW